MCNNLKNGVGSGTVVSLKPNLVAWWEMSESAGNALVDSTGRGNTLTDVAAPIAVAGKVGSAKQYNGTNTYNFDNNDRVDLQFHQTNLSLAFWVFYSNIVPIKPIIGKTGRVGLTIQSNSGSVHQLSYQIPGPTTVNLQHNITITTGQWYFICVVLDRTGLNQASIRQDITYISAAMTGNLDDPNATDLDFVIGAASDKLTFVAATIDSVGIWKRALSTQEQDWLYNAGNGRAYSEL